MPVPGQKATVPLTVQAPWYWMGTPQSRPFRVHLTPEDGDPPPPAMADFLQRPVIPQWVPRFAAAPHHREAPDQHRHAHWRWCVCARSTCARAHNSRETSAQIRFA